MSAETSPDVPRETTAGLLADLMGTFEPRACSDCGESWMVRRDMPVGTCPRCSAHKANAYRVGVESSSLLENAERWVLRWCQRAGMSPRECEADLRHPSAARVAGEMAGFTTSGILGRGFGLSGGAGIGKTFALAAAFKAGALARWRARAPLEGMRAAALFLRWVRWPEEVARMRTAAASRDDGMERSDARARQLAEVEALVLDDLGAERLRGSYTEDWSASVLDLIVDRRFNERRPTWWTTNLSGDEFRARYGARLWSRLAGDNPVIEMTAARDQRMRRAP